MTYPKPFTPTFSEIFYVGGVAFPVPKTEVMFIKWQGTPVRETFGGKPMVDHLGHPVFAELAIMRTFLNDGWQTRWVETYGKKVPICLAYWKDDKYCTQVDKPFDDSSIMDLLAEIAKVNGNSYSGCWDVVSRKGDDILFAESKRTRKDSIRQSQQNWFASALRCGLKKENFLMVQWDFQP